jgi:hypothetical protein
MLTGCDDLRILDPKAFLAASAAGEPRNVAATGRHLDKGREVDLRLTDITEKAVIAGHSPIAIGPDT